MIYTIIGYLAIFIYLGVIAGVFRKLIKRKNGLPLGNLTNEGEQMTVLLTLPALLLVPLSQSFWDLHLVAKSLDLDAGAIFSRLSVMMSIHFVATVVGSLLILIADNVFYNGLIEQDDDIGNRSMLIGMVVLAVVFAGIVYYPLVDLMTGQIPPMELKGFQ
ncbi:MAG: hypothetical protein JJ975_08190 [Bacteroidia bacterium]|nr:hypothetical protein [Bacteroidia bacterium]